MLARRILFVCSTHAALCCTRIGRRERARKISHTPRYKKIRSTIRQNAYFGSQVGPRIHTLTPECASVCRSRAQLAAKIGILARYLASWASSGHSWPLISTALLHGRRAPRRANDGPTLCPNSPNKRDIGIFL